MKALCFYVTCPLQLRSRLPSTAVLFACMCVCTATERLQCKPSLSCHMCRPVATRARLIILRCRCADGREKLVHFPGILPVLPLWSFCFYRLPTAVRKKRFLRGSWIEPTNPSVLARDHQFVCVSVSSTSTLLIYLYLSSLGNPLLAPCDL